jgi:hypothetical protein
MFFLNFFKISSSVGKILEKIFEGDDAWINPKAKAVFNTFSESVVYDMNIAGTDKKQFFFRISSISELKMLNTVLLTLGPSDGRCEIC